ncbi:19848_t:CDS:2, partial [Racocetra persica]
EPIKIDWKIGNFPIINIIKLSHLLEISHLTIPLFLILKILDYPMLRSMAIGENRSTMFEVAITLDIRQMPSL